MIKRKIKRKLKKTVKQQHHHHQKVTPDIPKQSTPIADETKPSTIPSVKKSNDTNENNQNNKEEALKTAPAGVAQLAADAEEEGEDAVTSDSKHKCKLKLK